MDDAPALRDSARRGERRRGRSGRKGGNRQTAFPHATAPPSRGESFSALPSNTPPASPACGHPRGEASPRPLHLPKTPLRTVQRLRARHGVNTDDDKKREGSNPSLFFYLIVVRLRLNHLRPVLFLRLPYQYQKASTINPNRSHHRTPRAKRAYHGAFSPLRSRSMRSQRFR